MKNLNHQLMKLCRQNRDGSFSTQATRSRILDLSANQLHALGYRHMQATSLKPKHVEALIAHWREQGASTGTLKNRLSALRWWAQKVNRESIIARDNTAYGIGSRTYVAEQSKAQALDQGKLAKIEDAHVRMSVRLQAAFGLRREEAIKFQPVYAMQGDHIQLKSSWTKGGRPRTVPITNDDQRRVLGEARSVGQGRCINTAPPELCATATSLRETNGKGRAIPFTWITTRLCTTALSRADWTGLSSGRRAAIETAYPRAASARPTSATHNQQRTRPRARSDLCGVSRSMKSTSAFAALLPRLVRFRDAPRYLGMDRNRFNGEVRPLLTRIPIGQQGIAFDRLELDAWVEDYISRNGRPAKRSELWDATNHRASRKEAASGGSTRKSKDTEDWRKAAARIISKRRSAI